MASIAVALKSEIQRLARKEIRAQCDPLRKTASHQRREIASLKREIRSLQSELKKRQAGKTPDRAPATAEARSESVSRITAKGIKALRARLGLSVADLGQIVGASSQSVYNWESGTVKPRGGKVVALAALRAKGKREVAAMLDGMREQEAA